MRKVRRSVLRHFSKKQHSAHHHGFFFGRLRCSATFRAPGYQWAAISWNARIRLKQENDRLQQELALLGEEMRIKDARRLRIPAQRRPHSPVLNLWSKPPLG